MKTEEEREGRRKRNSPVGKAEATKELAEIERPGEHRRMEF